MLDAYVVTILTLMAIWSIVALGLNVISGFAGQFNLGIGVYMGTGAYASAMLTTAGGLVVAIPCLAGYYMLNNRSEFLIDKIEEKALGLANILSAMKQRRVTDGATR